MAAWPAIRTVAVAAAVAGAGCTQPDPAATGEPQNASAPVEAAHARGAEAGNQAAGEALCRITYGDEGETKARLTLQGRVGDISLHAERGGLLCSEPAGLKGDCQVVRGKTVIVAQVGKPDARIEALTAAPYMVYGPDGVRCAPPPPAVR